MLEYLLLWLWIKVFKNILWLHVHTIQQVPSSIYYQTIWNALHVECSCSESIYEYLLCKSKKKIFIMFVSIWIIFISQTFAKIHSDKFTVFLLQKCLLHNFQIWKWKISFKGKSKTKSAGESSMSLKVEIKFNQHIQM